MELKEAISRAISEVFKLYRMEPHFPLETVEFPASVEDQICLLISFSQVLKGKVVFKFDKSLGEKIVSSVSETSVESDYETVKSVLGEIFSFTSVLALGKYGAAKNVPLLSPILIKGQNLSLMISRLKTNNLVFQLFNGYVSVTFCLE